MNFIIPTNHPCLPGHFPGNPIVPGVVLLDHIVATLGILPAGFTSVRFSHPVRPGDLVEVSSDADRFAACVDGKIAVQGVFTARNQ